MSPEVDKNSIPYLVIHFRVGAGIVNVALVVCVVVKLDVAVLAADVVGDVVGVVTSQLWKPPCIHVSDIAFRLAAVLLHSVESNGMFSNAHAMSSTALFFHSGPRNS